MRPAKSAGLFYLSQENPKMKGTILKAPLEWTVETSSESWEQGEIIKGILKVKNHGTTKVELKNMGVGLALAEIKKVQSRSDGAIQPNQTFALPQQELSASEEIHGEFQFALDSNAYVTDKKASFYLCFGSQFNEGQLQLRINPRNLFTKISGLFETFYRFKLKEYKGSKKGVEFKFTPPQSREMANMESMSLHFSFKEDQLILNFDFQIKKLDTSSVTNKINKESVKIEKILAPKEYSLGKGMINQEVILKKLDEVLSEVKLNNIF